ncbi:unnamed protein product [Bursaphelenchus xylophilus]|uniref:(pine wood nematode) hypothetical protein n=1 Tax=Bursaphelenchus xylophilus TaxID=6326 RepID=A0A1I7RU74_BURXY|nr:unnamed protein product [Bursaphelenchus xylophilus]CAG9113889.1 unnamed protein product [Bursaphelenchus xylophilus]
MRRVILVGLCGLLAVVERADSQGLPSFSLLSPNFLSPQLTKNHNQFIKNGPSSRIFQNSAVINTVNGGGGYCGPGCQGANGVPPVHVTLCICNNNNHHKSDVEKEAVKKAKPKEEEEEGETHTVIIPEAHPPELIASKGETGRVPPSYQIQKDRRLCYAKDKPLRGRRNKMMNVELLGATTLRVSDSSVQRYYGLPRFEERG